MNLFLIKLKRWVQLWLKQTVLEIFAPFIDRNAVLQFFAYPFFVYLLWINKGRIGIGDILSSSTTEVMAIVLAMPLYIAFSSIRAVFITVKESTKKGKWDGNSFVYKRPERIFTKKISSEKLEQDFLVKIKDAEPNSFVDFHVSYNRDSERVKSQIGNVFMSNWECISSKTQCGSLINNKKEVTLRVRIEPSTNDTIIYVDILSWKINK